MCYVVHLFFFFKQKTAYELRISDWSSDVCSSDLLFHKGRVLYNLSRARKAAHDTGELLVTAGYMDVIALAEGGFPAAVAPLGTALTEEQIEECWRLAAEPTLCFDGDAAGQRAALRARLAANTSGIQ